MKASTNTANSMVLWGVALLATGFVPSDAQAVDIGVVPKKLIVVDKLVAASKAKTVFVSKDQSGGITKGSGTDPTTISVQFDWAYANGNTQGGFALPVGASDGTEGWLINKTTVAKYVNKAAPGGSTQTKVGVVKPGKLLKLVAKGLGDTSADIIAAGDPNPGAVLTAYCVTNDGSEFCHCSEFGGCVYKAIAGGTGAKLVCKSGIGDAACSVRAPSTTTTLLATTTSTSTTPPPPTTSIVSTTTTSTTMPTAMCTFTDIGDPCGDGSYCFFYSAVSSVTGTHEVMCLDVAQSSSVSSCNDCTATQGCLITLGFPISYTCYERCDGCPDCIDLCSIRECGIDGCGGSCGTCAAPATCAGNGAGSFCCTPDCTGQVCGGGGCLGTDACGSCPGDQICLEDGSGCCAPSGTFCTSVADCCGTDSACLSNTCCRTFGASCSLNSSCCSGNCSSGICLN